MFAASLWDDCRCAARNFRAYRAVSAVSWPTGAPRPFSSILPTMLLVSKGSTKPNNHAPNRNSPRCPREEGKDTMFEKAGRYYADWRDTTGKRLRKSFTSKRAALQHEADQKAIAHPRGLATGRQSQPYSSPGRTARTAGAVSTKRPSSSSRKPDRKPRATSPTRTRSKSTRRSGATVIPIAR